MESLRHPTRCAHRGAAIVCCILAAAVMTSGLAIAAGPSERVLIRNVRMIDPEGETDYIVVNLLVKGGKLDIVTKDEITSDRADLVVDADNGVLFGQLELGQPPSFLIFDVDPREDPEALLDTKTHARFATRRFQVCGPCGSRGTFVLVEESTQSFVSASATSVGWRGWQTGAGW